VLLGDHAVTGRHDLTNQEEAEKKVPTLGRWSKQMTESRAAFGNLPNWIGVQVPIRRLR
jgi:hypothetical protein